MSGDARLRPGPVLRHVTKTGPGHCDTVLTCEQLPLPWGPADTSMREKMGSEPAGNSKPRHPSEAWGVVCWVKMRGCPRSCFIRHQPVRPSRIYRRREPLPGFGAWRTLIAHLAQCVHPLLHLVEGTCGPGYRRLRGGEMPGKQVTARASPRQGQICLGSGRPELGTVPATTEGESGPRSFGPSSGRGQKLQGPPQSDRSWQCLGFPRWGLWEGLDHSQWEALRAVGLVNTMDPGC